MNSQIEKLVESTEQLQSNCDTIRKRLEQIEHRMQDIRQESYQMSREINQILEDEKAMNNPHETLVDYQSYIKLAFHPYFADEPTRQKLAQFIPCSNLNDLDEIVDAILDEAAEHCFYTTHQYRYDQDESVEELISRILNETENGQRLLNAIHTARIFLP